MRSLFQIQNRRALEVQREALPLMQHLLRVIGSGCGLKRITLMEEEVQSSNEWILFRNRDGGGVGIDRGEVVSGLSPLQRKLDLVRTAHLVIGSLGGARSSELELAFESKPPSGWSVMEADAGVHFIRCAVGPPFVKIGAPVTGSLSGPVVAVRIFAELPKSFMVPLSGIITFRDFMCVVPELGVCARCTSEGGDMEIAVKGLEDVGEQKIPGVRLDLGEIEVRLCDLVGLRPGVAINLGAVKLERCFIRLGSTTLAEGIFSSRGSDLVLTIESVD